MDGLEPLGPIYPGLASVNCSLDNRVHSLCLCCAPSINTSQHICVLVFNLVGCGDYT
jgi:hypothetical protein